MSDLDVTLRRCCKNNLSVLDFSSFQKLQKYIGCCKVCGRQSSRRDKSSAYFAFLFFFKFINKGLNKTYFDCFFSLRKFANLDYFCGVCNILKNIK